MEYEAGQAADRERHGTEVTDVGCVECAPIKRYMVISYLAGDLRPVLIVRYSFAVLTRPCTVLGALDSAFIVFRFLPRKDREEEDT